MDKEDVAHEAVKFDTEASIGFVVAENDDMIMLAQSAGFDDEYVADLIQILKPDIQKIIELWNR